MTTAANTTDIDSQFAGLPKWFTQEQTNTSWLTELDALEDVCFQCPKSCNKCDTDGCTEYKYIRILQWIVIIIVAIVVGQVFGFVIYKRYLTNKKKRDEAEPLQCVPNTMKLITVKENELELHQELGTGAFGTVHRATWKPAKEKDHPEKGTWRIKVAVKTLNESKSSILEEALTMACCEHKHLVRFVAICQSQPPKLITEYLARGDALRFVRKRKAEMSSKQLLLWCRQIAEGMAYLSEEKDGDKLVHRDLAARNILVKNPNHVKIADFGLAQMVNKKPEFIDDSGGRMPLKWLAIECIQKGLYSHKSDVWSFGVTIWELLTYGKKPFTNVSARDLLDLLTKGGRLEQPDNCSTEMYTLMLTCWFLDADTRPKFSKIVADLVKMEDSPSRYVVITPKTPGGRTSSSRTPKKSINSPFPPNIEDADEVELDDYIFQEESDTRFESTAIHGEQDKPFYENAPFIEAQRQPKMSDSLLTNEFYVPKLQPAPAVANWRRREAEPRYMNSTGGMTASTHASTSSWQSSSAAATPTDYLNTGALALYANNNSVEEEHLLRPMSSNNRKRTISNPRYMSLSERENSVSDS